MQASDRIIRWASTVGVIVLAGIAAVISYKHMYQLVLRYGETTWTAALLPVSVDGMIVVASLSLLADSRHGRCSRILPWTLLVLGSAASLAAGSGPQANRTPAGDLPSGKEIAQRFGRRERWGRLVKQAGLAGALT